MSMYTTLGRSSSIESDLEPLYSDGGARSHSRRFKNFLAVIFVALFCTMVLIAVIVAATNFPPEDVKPTVPVTPPPGVNTTCGPVTGIKEDGAYVFKGIPYSVPPVGNRRWKPPASLLTEGKCWKGALRADEFGSKCYQKNLWTLKHEGSEDCLFVNVWTPELSPSADLDVMVYIHGGRLLYSSGNELGMSPTSELARNTNMVYVSFNYRLNVFGFLALNILSMKSPSGTSGNYGFMDQILALRWVQSNIRAFGGNPNKVTLMGVGSGATSVFALMGAPQARRLFHRGWLLSGSPLLNGSQYQAELDNMEFLNKTLCNKGPGRVRESYECIYMLPPESVMNSVSWHQWNNLQAGNLPHQAEKQPIIATIDGDILPKPPIDALKDGSGSDIPLLIGNVGQEADALSVPEDIETGNWARYEAYIKSSLDPFKHNVTGGALSLYHYQISPKYQYTTMVSDVRAICPTDLQAKLMARVNRSPVYRYIVTSFPSRPINIHGNPMEYAFHGWDLISFLGTTGQYIDSPSKKDNKLRKNLRRIIMDFVKDGQTRRWHKFPQATGVISGQINSQHWYHGNECDFWVDKGLTPDYAWVN